MDVSCGQLAARLMGLLASALSAVAEQDVPAVWSEVRAQHLCVLANHEEAAVRVGVVEVRERERWWVICVYFQVHSRIILGNLIISWPLVYKK